VHIVPRLAAAFVAILLAAEDAVPTPVESRSKEAP
jgi:hypothetical protein